MSGKFEFVTCSTSSNARSFIAKRRPFAVVVFADAPIDKTIKSLNSIAELAGNARLILCGTRNFLKSEPVSELISRRAIHEVIEVEHSATGALLPRLTQVSRLHELENHHVNGTRAPSKGQSRLVGTSAVIMKVKASIRRFGHTDLPVLITGESGTGKEVTAQAIHETSGNRGGPFVPINCAALPSSLIGSELFGYEKGAFTGADQKKIGHIELAESGTLFLDEIGDMPLDTQAHLLRFLQEGTIVRLGGTQTIRVNTRVIVATNRDLEEAVQRGEFREDLYYRLKVLLVELPPLRQRGEDVQILADHFLNVIKVKHKRHGLQLSQDARRGIQAFGWPGNVRELMSAIARAVVMSPTQTIHPADLGIPTIDETSRSLLTLAEAREETDRKMLMEAFIHSGRNATRAAACLGISRVSFYRLLKKYELVLSEHGSQRSAETVSCQAAEQNI